MGVNIFAIRSRLLSRLLSHNMERLSQQLYMMDGPFSKDARGRVCDGRNREARQHMGPRDVGAGAKQTPAAVWYSALIAGFPVLQIVVYPGAARALEELLTDPRFTGVRVAYASRTDEPEWAAQCMRLLRLPGGKTLAEAGPLVEIMGGSKKRHFGNLAKRTGLPYHDMLFFDNEQWNITEVQQLGVVCMYTPGGMTEAGAVFLNFLRLWQGYLRLRCRSVRAQ